MARGSLDWVVGWWFEGMASNIVGTETVLSLVGLPELEVYENDLIIERVVGQYKLVNMDTAGNPTVMHARLYTTSVDGTGVGPGYIISDFATAEQQFMWHKVHYLEAASSSPEAATNMASTLHPEWSHLDVKVNRRLGDLEELRLQFQTWSNDQGYQYAAWIRVLVRH